MARNIENIVPDSIKDKLGNRVIDTTLSELVCAVAFAQNYDFMPKKEEIMSTAQFAEYMEVDERTLYRIIERNELKEIRLKVGRKWKWNSRSAWNPEVLKKMNEYTY